MIINLFGLIFIGVAVYFFKLGAEFDGAEFGYMTKVRLITTSFLILLLGIACFSTSNTLCDVFGLFC